jgi:hypothetical protein
MTNTKLYFTPINYFSPFKRGKNAVRPTATDKTRQDKKILVIFLHYPGADPGSAPGARPPKIGKNKIFWRKIVIFHTKYPKKICASLRSAQFFSVRPP